MCLAISLPVHESVPISDDETTEDFNPLQDPSWQAALTDNTYTTFDVFIDPPTIPSFLASSLPVIDNTTGRPNRARPRPRISLEIRTETSAQPGSPIEANRRGATLFVRFSWARYITVYPETWEEVFQAWIPERFVVPEPLYRLYLRADGGYIFQFYTIDGEQG
ncbi:hypothetical protein BJ508DRAFT_312531 [Ascobolus immersus RN42]|uniref:Uncharacterized protein n=1 Tax=Ascobolus immersus RN42 TaxID=1160509 RepID=A0A3N4HQT0_ASCIM|nr:hypothetical protein BJ508DRAFT_312531 [Ascobolus immersus RN42]